MFVETRKHPSCIQLEDLAVIIVRQVQRVDIAFRIVEVMACLGVDAANGSNHFRCEKNVVYIDDVE